jgi:hypothetical protein
MSWEALRDSYKKSGIVLALGAGVSVGAGLPNGLPNWIKLLERSELSRPAGATLPGVWDFSR